MKGIFNLSNNCKIILPFLTSLIDAKKILVHSPKETENLNKNV